MSKRAAFWRKTLTDLAIMTVIGAFLAVIGPFGSIAEPLAVRLITWLLFSYIGYAIYSPMGYLVDRAHAALNLPLAPLWLAASLIASVPMTAVIYTVQYLPNWPALPSLEAGLTSYFYVFVIGGGVTLLFNIIGAGAFRKAETPAPSASLDPHPEPRPELAPELAPQPPAQPAQQPPAPVQDETPAAAHELANPLLDQLPAELGSEVIALEMEDHYVRVHTMLGSDLVLMRLRDAMVHVADIDGRQVHRSWWVARLAVEDVKREGRNVRLVLASNQASGLEAPVSRAQIGELKDAGWI